MLTFTKIKKIHFTGKTLTFFAFPNYVISFLLIEAFINVNLT